jgi:hypothetical protein
MAIRDRWDPELRTLFVELSGVVNDAELVGYGQRLLRRDDIPLGHNELIDLRELEATDVESASLRETASAFRGQDKTVYESRVAVVATSDVAFGLARMYQSFRGDSTVEFEVFRDIAGARSWLGLDPEGPGV